MNTITIIGNLFTFSSFIWLFLFFLKSRGREYIISDIKSGSICYRCKSDIRDRYDINFYGVEGKKELCKSCKRDGALSEVIDGRMWYKKIDLTDDKWNTTFLWLSLLAVVFNSLNILIIGLNVVGGTSLFLAQGIFYFRYMAISRKKTQSN